MPDCKGTTFTLASTLFKDTSVQITTDGKPHLGAALGTQSFIETYVTHKVEQWSNEVKHLSLIAKSQPHATYSAFTHGKTSKWKYIA